MRKWLLAVLSLATVCTMSACAGESATTESSDGSSVSESVQESTGGEDSSEAHQHTAVKTERKEATCTESGNVEYWTCSDCNKIYSDETCTSEIAIEDTVIGATGHSGVKTSAVAATCTDTGNIEYWTCDACGKIYSDEACTNEIAIEDTVIAATGHSGVKTSAVAATCTEAGNIDYWTCEDCGKIYSDEACTSEIALADTVIGATGHSAAKTEAVAATCTDTGNTEYWTCAACGKIYSDEACTNEIAIADTVIAATGVHTFNEDGDCGQCDAKVSDKALYLNDAKNGTVTYTDNGWKISAIDKTLGTYNVTLNKEITAWNIAQGNTTLTITFGGSFDETDYGTGNPVNCTKWIVPYYAEPQMDGEGNIEYQNWSYNAGFISQLTANGDGTYTATIDLTDTAYDFVNNALQICISIADVNGAEIGDCYVTDISYLGDPTEAEYLVESKAVSGTTTNIVYDETAKTYTVNATTDAGYFQIDARVVNYWIENGYTTAKIYFKNNATSAVAETWKQVQFNSNTTYSAGVILAATDLYAGVTKELTLADYTNGIYFFTDKCTGCDLIMTIALSDGTVQMLEKADWMASVSNCDVTYTEGSGWKATATSEAAYKFTLSKDVTAYYINEGMTTLKITFGGSFDGTSHTGNPVNCTKWILPYKADGSGEVWTYNQGFISQLTSNGDGTYTATIDLTDTTYDFVNNNINIYVNYADVSSNAVGACYIHNIEFSE